MLEKALNVFKKVVDKPLKGGSLLLLYAMVLAILVFVLLYLGSWVYLFFFLGKATLGDLLALGTLLVSPSAISAITFYSVAIIDRDGDGESDLAEEKLKGGE